MRVTPQEISEPLIERSSAARLSTEPLVNTLVNPPVDQLPNLRAIREKVGKYKIGLSPDKFECISRLEERLVYKS